MLKRISILCMVLFVHLLAGEKANDPDAITSDYVNCRVNAYPFGDSIKRAVCLIARVENDEIVKSMTGFLIKSYNEKFIVETITGYSFSAPFLLTSAKAFKEFFGEYPEKGMWYGPENVKALKIYFDYEQNNFLPPVHNEDLYGWDYIDFVDVFDHAPGYDPDFVLLYLHANWQQHGVVSALDKLPRLEPLFTCLDWDINSSVNFDMFHFGGNAPRQYAAGKMTRVSGEQGFTGNYRMDATTGIVETEANGAPLLLEGTSTVVGMLPGVNERVPMCGDNGSISTGYAISFSEEIFPHIWGWIAPENWQTPSQNLTLARQGIQSVNDYCVTPISSPPEIAILDPISLPALGLTQYHMSGFAADEDGIAKVTIDSDYFQTPIVCNGQEAWHCDHLPITRSRNTTLVLTVEDNTGVKTTKEIFLEMYKAVSFAGMSGYKVDVGHNRIEWETACEVDNLGFELYRNKVKDFTTATKLDFIYGEDSLAGWFYTYDDKTCGSRAVHYYWLRDIDANTMTGDVYGPVEIRVVPQIAVEQTSNPYLRVHIPGPQKLGETPYWGNMIVYNGETGANLGKLSQYITPNAQIHYWWETRSAGTGHDWPKGNQYAFPGSKAQLRGKGLPRTIRVRLPGFSVKSNKLDLGTEIAGLSEIHLKRGTKNIYRGSRDAIAAVPNKSLFVSYRIYNYGKGDLKLSGRPRVSIRGSHASVIAYPSASIAPGQSSVLKLRLSAIKPGYSERIRISISNNDNNENPYYFSIFYSYPLAIGPIVPSPTPIRLMLEEGIEIVDEGLVPEEFVLEQNHPNPFNPETTIRFHLPEATTVELTIYNLHGQKVKTLLSQKLQAGVHQVLWNGKNEKGEFVPSGSFFYVLEAGEYREVKKMTLLK